MAWALLISECNTHIFGVTAIISALLNRGCFIAPSLKAKCFIVFFMLTQTNNGCKSSGKIQKSFFFLNCVLF